MSDRDDIEVVEKAENSSASSMPGSMAGSENPDNGTIRQTSPTDTSDKPKTNLLDRLKRAFSTEEDPEAESLESAEKIPDGENLFESLLGRFKGQKDGGDTKSSEIREPERIEQTDSAEKGAPTEEIAVAEDNGGKESDPMEEEEFMMINAFLEGEEYQKPSSEKSGDFDSQSAFDEEEAVFDLEEDSEEEDKNGAGSEKEQSEQEANDNADSDSAAAAAGSEENSGVGGSDDEADSETEAADKADSEAAPADDGKQSSDSADQTSGNIDDTSSDSQISEGDPADQDGEPKNDAPSDDKDEKQGEAAPSVRGEDPDEQAGADSGEGVAEAEDLTEEKKETSESERETEPLEESGDPDDEEFVFEEDFLFDEGDEELSELAKADGSDDFGELSTIFKDDEEKLTEEAPESAEASVPDTKEYSSNELQSEPLDREDGDSDPIKEDDEKESSDTAADTDAEKTTAEQSDREKSAEAEKAAPADDNGESASEAAEADKAGDDSTEKAPEKSENDSEAEAAAESGNAASEKDEQVPTEAKAEEKTEGKPNTQERAKIFFGRVKNKLSELWNAKDEAEQTKEESKNEVQMTLSEASDSDVVNSEPENTNTSDPESTAANNVSDNNDDQAQNAADQEEKPETAENNAGADRSEKDGTSEDETSDEISEETEKSQDNAEADSVKDDSAKNENNEIDEKKADGETVPKTPVISIIKNDNVTQSNFDKDKLREKLNVIERGDTDVLTDEQKKELETNRKVLERVQKLEEQTQARREEIQAAAREREASASVTVTELEVTNYYPEPADVIRFSEGKFSESVRSEYDCIINYKRMRSVSTKEALVEAAPAEKDKTSPKPAKLPEIGQSEIPELREARDFERNHDRLDSICKKLDYQDERSPEPVEYRTEEDASEVRKYIAKQRRNDSWVGGITIGLTLISFIFACFAGKFTVGAGTESVASLQRIYAAVNFLIYAGAVFCCKDIIIGGLKPLARFKANPDTGVAAASAAAAVQALLAIIFPQSFMGQRLNVYTLIVMLTLSVCCAGKYLNSDRISANFRFVSDTAQKYAGKFFPDQRMVAKLLSGMKNSKTELSFQKKTTFLKHFMRISKAEDPGEKLASSFALPAMIMSLLIAIIAGIVSRSFLGAWSVLCVMLCAGVPISSRALAAFPLHRLAKRSLMNKSMIVGYSAVETFSESAAVMIDAKDLYPEGSITMNDFKALDPYRWQNGVYAAAAVVTAAGGATSSIFDSMIGKASRNSIPNADNVMYEDGKGLIGWVKGERVLVGNHELLLAHGVPATKKEDEPKFKKNESDEVMYIAVAGRLVGVLVVGYTPNHRVADVLKKMEASDMSLLVRTIDVNITAERIARDFGIGPDCIKVLEQKRSNVIRDEMVGKEKASPAFIATKGGVTSFGLAVSECIQTKRNVTLCLAIEIVGALLKILVVTAIVLFPGVHHIGAVQLFLFSLFWVVAVICAPIVVQRIQEKLGSR